MRVLGLDTATAATAVAVLDGARGTAVTRHDDPPSGARPRHTTRLMELVVSALAEAGIGWDAIDRIAVGIGPGTFTGLRIGVATARALAAARGLELVGISTLRSLAVAAADPAAASHDGVLAVLDARRGEAFAAGWATGEAAPVLAPCPLSPEALATIAMGLPGRWLAVGDGAILFRDALERARAEVPADESPLHRVDALTHCRLALAQPADAPAAVVPEYLRVPDAERLLAAGRSA